MHGGPNLDIMHRLNRAWVSASLVPCIVSDFGAFIRRGVCTRRLFSFPGGREGLLDQVHVEQNADCRSRHHYDQHNNLFVIDCRVWRHAGHGAAALTLLATMAYRLQTQKRSAHLVQSL